MRQNLASLIVAAVVTALPVSSMAGSAENQCETQWRHQENP